jgi:predicted dehydrogenase
MPERVRVGIVGCGNIAGPYAANLVTYPETELVGVTDVDAAKAEALAQKHGCRAYGSLEALLADVDLAVNLTIHHAHYAVTKACLEAGKPVYSEKPLALTAAEARELVNLAKERNLRLGASPFTFLGAAQQAAWRLVRDGKLGEVRLAYAEVNWGRIESWHPNPGPFYEVGALWDVGVYPLTLLSAIFGPARKVLAYGRVLHPDRVTKAGAAFHIETPDFVTAAIELEGGPLVRLTTDFYVHQQNTRQTGVELHGDLGSLHLSSWQDPDAGLAFAPFGQPLERVPVRAERMEWGRGVREMAQAMLEGRPHRATGEQAAHIVEVLGAVSESIRTGGPVDVRSSFPPPAPEERA